MVFNPDEFPDVVCHGATLSDCTGVTERNDVEVGTEWDRGRLLKLRLLQKYMFIKLWPSWNVCVGKYFVLLLIFF